MKPKILLALPMPDDLRERVAEIGDPIRPKNGPFPTADELESLLPTLAGIVSTINTRFDSATIAAAKNLRVISNCAVGLDNIDLAAATQQRIAVCNTPGVQDAAVAELALALVMALARNMLTNDSYVRAGEWQRRRAAPLGGDIRGKVLGLIGMGGIGRHLARSAHALGMDVVYFKRTRDHAAEQEGIVRFAERDRVLETADFLSLHAPLTNETRGMIGAAEFSRMKRGAYFVNTARGAIVDEAALVAALASNHLAGAGLDVMTEEPLPPTHPLVALPNVILQPHAAGATRETRRRMEEAAIANLLAIFAGQMPPAIVNPEVLA